MSLSARNTCGGFTLMEVLVALAIIAVVLVTCQQAIGLQARNLATMQQRVYAQWVGLNTLNGILMTGDTGRRQQYDLRETMMGQDFRVDVSQHLDEEATTITVEIEVALMDSPSEKLATFTRQVTPQ